MTFNWLRQDPAVRASLHWLIIAPLNMSALLGVVAWKAASAARAAQLEPGSWTISSSTTWASLCWFAVALYLLAPGVRQRSSRLMMTLPLSPRKLWLTHLVAVIVSEAAILLVAAGWVVVLAWLVIHVFDGRNLFAPDAVRLALVVSAGVVLGAVLLQSPKPSLHKIPLSKGYLLYMLATLLGVLGIMVVLGSLPLPFAMLPIGAAVAASWLTYRSLPTAFTLVPREAEPRPVGARREESSRASRGFPYKWFLGRTVGRSLYGRWLQYWWIASPFIASMGILLTGVPWIENSDLYYQRITLIPITVYLLLAFAGLPFRNLYRLDPLPISRRPLFALAFIPSLLFLSLGYGIGRIWGVLSPPRESIAYRMDRDSHYFLYVPAGMNEIAWNGELPVITSPWGETHEAWSTPLYEGSRAVLYSPYHTPLGSSLDFVALQISRATGAIYEEAVPSEEIAARYLAVDGEGKVILKGKALTIQADFPYLKRRSKGPMFPVILTLVGLPWAILVLIYLLSFRATISDRMRNAFLFGLMFAVLALHLVQYVLLFNDLTEDWILTGVVEILVRQGSAALPGTLAMWIGCTLFLYAGYRLAESRFLHIEIPPKPQKMHPFEEWVSN